jgi:hypothetical protein
MGFGSNVTNSVLNHTHKISTGRDGDRSLRSEWWIVDCESLLSEETIESISSAFKR